jgi:hypothetical protein
MAIPDTRDGLESVGYKYTGSSACRGCGAELHWYDTPRGKKMPLSVVSGSEDEDPEKLEFHKCEGK